MKKVVRVKRIPSNASLSSASSYKSIGSNSTNSTTSNGSEKIILPGHNMKRIKGNLSKKLKKGQKLASSMILSPSKRRSRRDMSAIEENSEYGNVDHPLVDLERKSSWNEKQLIEFADFDTSLPINLQYSEETPCAPKSSICFSSINLENDGKSICRRKIMDEEQNLSLQIKFTSSDVTSGKLVS